MNQRNSEETIRNSIDLNPRIDLDEVDELKRELKETKSRLAEVEGKFVKIKASEETKGTP